MQVFILTLGTQGDLELFLTLGRELHSRGHQVVLGTSKFYLARVQDAQVEWKQLGNGTRDELLSVLQSLSSVQDKTKRTYLYCQRWLQSQLSTATHQITSIAERTDYFISNLKIALEREGKIIPGAAVTYDPPAEIADLWKYSTQKYNGMMIDIVAMNKKLLDPQDLWGEPYRFTGFWTNEPRFPWTPPVELLEFLDNGPPPVVITMGSMVMFDTIKFVQDITQALHLSAQRGIIVGGWSGISHVDTPPGLVCCVSEIPYDWLFPKASCVIHHGGVGTVAAVLQAGKPSIVLPQLLCQEHFGEILIRENLATGIFDVDTLNPCELADAIQRAVMDKQSHQSAKHWQQVILEDKGVGAAADLIEAHWNQLNRSGTK